MKRTLLSLATAASVAWGLRCSASSPKPSAGAAPAPTAEAPTPTPTPSLRRLNPNIVEETATHIIERYPKNTVLKVDERHIRHPLVGPPVEFFKEDENYYYVFTPKAIPEEQALKEQAEAMTAVPGPTPVPAEGGGPPGPVLGKADFADISPPRVSGRIRLQEIKDTGLPRTGMWRASFVVADMNGDGIPDIVAPPARLGGTEPSIWLGDGKGKFTEWPIKFTEEGKPARFGIGYGGVAVGDIDKDGRLDMVIASHGGAVAALFGDGKGNFEVVRRGLPGREFSAQAVALADVDGDGKLDIIVSRDIVEQSAGEVDRSQIRVYLTRGRGFVFEPRGIVGGFYSNSLHAWDYDGDGKRDILTGSHYPGALTILWKNTGKGTFTPVAIPPLEPYAFHFATVPGTWGKNRVPAFADAYGTFVNEPINDRAAGITIYSYEGGTWTRHRVWRKEQGNSYLYGVALGDLDGDGLDDVVFPDSEKRKLRIFFQEPDGSFKELAEAEEPDLDSPGQCVRLADIDRDGRLDIILSKTIAASSPKDPGGWSVYRNVR